MYEDRSRMGEEPARKTDTEWVGMSFGICAAKPD
jgi:hypothetical protein